MRAIRQLEPAPSTSSSSIGSETDSQEEAPPPPIPPKLPPPHSLASLGQLSLNQNSPSESEDEEEEEEEEAQDMISRPVQSHSACEVCKQWKDNLKALQLEHTLVNNRLSATVAELHTVKKAAEEIESRAKTEKSLFDEKTASFEQRIDQLGQRLDALLKNYQEYRRSTESEFIRLERERETAQMLIMEVEEHYRTLLGKRRDAAAEMSAPIDLPSNRDDLELYALQMREDLLSTSVAREHLLHRLDAQIATHRDQLIEERRRRLQVEDVMQKRLQDANERIAELTRANEAAAQAAAARQAAERVAERATTEAKQNHAASLRLSESLRIATEESTQLRNRVLILQNDLEISQRVSKDFVRLSQNLQVQLENQRQQTHELRWQDPEDVTNCSACKTTFQGRLGGSLEKSNCRHCGHIFCPNCLSKVLPPDGVRSRPAPVCDMCHTLLVKDVAPYFSKNDFSRDSEEKDNDDEEEEEKVEGNLEGPRNAVIAASTRRMFVRRFPALRKDN